MQPRKLREMPIWPMIALNQGFMQLSLRHDCRHCLDLSRTICINGD